MSRHSFAYLFERFPSFVQTFVYREAVEMAREGMNPLFISIRRPEEPEDIREKLDLDVVYLPESESLRAEIDMLRETRKLHRAVHRALPKVRTQPDSTRLFEAAWIGPLLQQEKIRHVHAHFGGLAARTAWWLRLFGISYSFTGHANDIFCKNDFPISNGDLVHDAEFVITETDYARQWMENHHPRAAGKIVRVYNGIDRDFPPREPPAETPRILSVGRLIEKKGFADLIEACRLLREHGLSFECAIVGEGPLRAQLQAQIDRASLADDIRLIGAQSQHEVRVLLSEADLFVLASVPESDGGSDNLPTVIIEAMMCGTPVISTRLAGIPEMIQHGENGILVGPRNAPALATAIEQLLRDRTLAGKLGTHGKGTAINKFSIETTTRALKHLLVHRAGIKPPKEARALDKTLPQSFLGRWF
jgi:glycosyltransferase involved in cell wall biosynthesis